MSRFSFFTERPIEKYKKADTALVILTFLLWGIGMVTLYFCSSGFGQRAFGNSLHFVERQLISSAVGFAALFFFASIKFDAVRKLLPMIVFGAIILCLLTFIPGIGVERNGARRWIKIPYFSTFQPSEAIKFALVLFLANFFDKQERIVLEEDKTVFPAFFGLIVFSGVVFAQQDFSTGLFVFLLGLVMFFVSGAKLSWFIPFSCLAIPAVFLMVLLKPYRVDRLIGFFSPESYSQTINYQTMAANRAISAGGFWGQGIGTGLTRINSIPEVQSDYVFAGWVEAMGLLGVILYLAVLGMFAWRTYYCSLTCSDRFAALTTFGFATCLVAQSLANIAVVGGVIPTTGIPLPFFSSGGSSIIFTLAMCGFMINASRLENVELVESNEYKTEELMYE
ncbi:MAG: cell division protein FtsW [Treponema sp.]|nr:cell division protein FtsW [Treponema sp.]